MPTGTPGHAPATGLERNLCPEGASPRRIPASRGALATLFGLAMMGLVPTPAKAQTGEVPQDAPSPGPGATPATKPTVASPKFGLTGDWNGLRTDLHDDGIDVRATLWSEVASNIAGGDHQDITQVSGWALTLDVDTLKTLGLAGGHFEVSFTKRQGPDINQRAGLQILLSPQEEYSRGQAFRLTDLWYQQQLGPITDVKLGRIPMGEDFAALPCEFMNVNFCANQIGPLVGNYWYNSPLAPIAARLRVKPGKFTFQVGVFQSNPNDEKEDVALYHSGADGVTVPIEAGLETMLGGLPGSYRVGGWYNSARADDLREDGNGDPYALSGLDPDRRRGRYGAYFLARQQLTGSYEDTPDGPRTTRGLTGFLNITHADRRTARTDSQIAAWLVCTGPFAGRPHDKAGIALSRENVNSRAARSETLAAPGSTAPRAEYASELYYAYQIVPSFVVSPNVQYIVHPGGYPDLKDIVVLGLKTMLTF